MWLSSMPGGSLAAFYNVARFWILACLGAAIGSAQTAPGFITGRTDQTADLGGELRMSAIFSGSTPMTFRWRRDGVTVLQSGPDSGAAGTATFVVAAAQAADAGTYVVEATNSAGTTASPLIPVVVRPARAPEFIEQGGDVRGNLAETIGVSWIGSPPFTYRWQRNGVDLPGYSGTMSDTSFGITLANVPGGREGAYTVEVSNRVGRIVSRPIRVLPADSTEQVYIYRQPYHLGLFFGQGAMLEARVSDAFAPRSYQWRRDGVPIPGATNFSHGFNFDPSLAGRYSVVMTTASGQTLTSDEAQVSLVGRASAAPQINLQPQSQSVRTGDCVTLSVDADAGFSPRFQWLKDGAPIPGATRAALFLPAVTSTDAGRYQVAISNERNVSTTSSEATVTVLPGEASPLAPILLAPPSSANFNVGSPVSLTVTAIGNPAPTVQWLKDNVPIPGATNSTFTLPSAQTGDSGSYVAVVTNASGVLRTAAATVNIITPTTKPVFAAAPPPRLSVELGGFLTLSFTVSANPTATFQWRKDGGPLTAGLIPTANATTTELRLDGGSGVTANAAGTYTVVATNSFGATTSDSIVVEVRPPYVPGIYMTEPGGASNFDGAGAYFGPDGKGICLLAVRGVGAPYVLSDVATSPDGAFSASVPVFSSQTTISGAVRGNNLRVSGDFAVSGGLPVPRRAAQGDFAAYSGYWRAALDAPNTGTAHLIVTPRGDALLVLQYPGGTRGMQVRLNADGTLRPASNALPFGEALDVRFNLVAGTFAGTASNTRTPAVSFSGARAGGPAWNRLADIATRGQAGAASESLIAGFVVTGVAPRDIMVRAIGPTLGGFGLAGVLSDSRLELFRDGAKIAENDDWGTRADAATIGQAAARVGAFALSPNSKDSVILSSLAPGAYSAQVTSGAGAPNAGGVALVEVYDAGDSNAPATAPRLANISTRGRVGVGEELLVAGIVVSGDAAKNVLVRAIGPGLGAFGVTGALGDPLLRIYRGNAVIYENDNWASSTELAAATSRVGAFALATGSKDAALLITLPPGAYTAQVSGAGGATGVALVEVYEVGDPP